MKPAFGRKSVSKPSASTGTIVPEKKVNAYNKRALDNSTAAKFLSSDANVVDKAYELIEPKLGERISPEQAKELSRGEAVAIIDELVIEIIQSHNLQINELEKRDLTTVLLNDLLTFDKSHKENKAEQEIETELAKSKSKREKDEKNQLASKESIINAKDRLQPLLLEYIDAAAANEMDRTDLADQVSEAVNELMAQEKINLNLREQRNW